MFSDNQPLFIIPPFWNILLIDPITLEDGNIRGNLSRIRQKFLKLNVMGFQYLFGILSSTMKYTGWT